MSWEKITQPKIVGGLGVRRAREANTTHLGKHIWELIHHHNKLCVHVLSSKYLKGKSIFNVGAKFGASFT